MSDVSGGELGYVCELAGVDVVAEVEGGDVIGAGGVIGVGEVTGASGGDVIGASELTAGGEGIVVAAERSVAVAVLKGRGRLAEFGGLILAGGDFSAEGPMGA